MKDFFKDNENLRDLFSCGLSDKTLNLHWKANINALFISYDCVDMEDRVYVQSPIKRDFESIVDAQFWVEHHLRAFIKAIEFHVKLNNVREFALKQFLEEANLHTTFKQGVNSIQAYILTCDETLVDVYTFADKAAYVNWLGWKDTAYSLIPALFWITTRNSI